MLFFETSYMPGRGLRRQKTGNPGIFWFPGLERNAKV